MSTLYPLMIPGAKAGKTLLEVHQPYDGTLIARVETANAAAAEQALKTAHALHSDRAQWLSISQRGEVLEKTATLMEQEAEDLALMIAREGGKPLLDARIEVARAIDGVRLCNETLLAQRGNMIPMGLNAASNHRLAYTRHEPIGVVMAFSAFNHPLNLIVHQVAPAIAAGCPVIVKPAEGTPLSCIRFVQLLHEAGLPEAWCQVAIVDNVEVAGKLACDSRLGFFAFIGSARVGWMLRSKLAPGVRCALEHGGVAPVIIEADADLDAAIPLLAKGGFYHAGQVCVSVQRIYAHESIARRVAKRLAAQAENMRVGDPTDAKTDVGPLIRTTEVERVNQWVTEAVNAGAEVLSGGKALSDTCYACTVVYDPPADSKLSRQEIFGPVVNVYPYSDRSDAIHRANSLEFAFQAAVFTRDIDAAMELSRQLNAATVMINDHTAFRVDWMPFAGLKQSGLGVGGIAYTLHDMQIEKLVVLHSKGL